MKISDTLTLWFVVFTLLATASAEQNTIRGVVLNRTTGQPAASDAAMLLRLDGVNPQIQEELEAPAHTDTQGAFIFHIQQGKVQRRDESYLVRVIHQNVIYDQPVSAGDSVSIAVFDAAPEVQGITGNIEILRLGTRIANNEKLLHVSDMYEIRNDSNPPMTLAGPHTFDVYLPANSRIDSVLASGPAPEVVTSQKGIQNQSKTGLVIPASPFPGQPGHYSVNFPLHPGATRFAFNYDLPYEGHVAFHPRVTFGFHQFAVMIPPVLHFSSRSAFTRLPVNGEYQVEAVGSVQAGARLAFEISGNGSLPVKADPSSAGAVESQNSTPATSGGSPDKPARTTVSGHIDSPAWPWLILISGILLGSSFLIRRIRAQRLRRNVAGQINRIQNTPSPVAVSLKDKLFQLETDRIVGVISDEQYASARQVLEEAVKRMIA